jgi:hypothetical protein
MVWHDLLMSTLEPANGRLAPKNPSYLIGFDWGVEEQPTPRIEFLQISVTVA